MSFISGPCDAEAMAELGEVVGERTRLSGLGGVLAVVAVPEEVAVLVVAVVPLVAVVLVEAELEADLVGVVGELTR